MKLLITGASGFVGQYYTQKYADKYEISTFSFRTNNIADLDQFSLQKIDVIIHLSALVHQMNGAVADEYERVNVVQTLELAKKAKSSGVKHFIFMSSIKVYGEETDTTYTEDSKCFPQDNYGKSKLKAEQLLQELEDENFLVSIIRTPIVYGYGVKANIKNLISLVQKVPILPFGKIENRRSVVYIGNICSMIDIIIQQKKSGIFLASDDISLSTTEFIQLIAKYLGTNVYLLKIPLFATILKALKPSFYKRLYKSLEVNNTKTKKTIKLQ